MGEISELYSSSH